MLRKIGFTLLCASATLCSNAYSMITHTLQPGITLEYELLPNEPQMFVNYMFWSIEANCKITTMDDNDDLFAEAVHKRGKINDVYLDEGQAVHVTVHEGDTIKVGADGGAKVKITNFGNHMVKAVCST